MNLDTGKNAIIRLFNVTKHYGGRPALQNVSMDILPGEFVFISGPSGAGKSTLLKILYLAETVSEGQILIDGMNLSRISPARLPFLRRRFGMVFQDFKLIPTRTVYDNVALVLEVAGKKPAFIRKKVMHVLRITGMEQKARELPPTLSGGEQQRVAVARAVAGDPDIILADEPTGNLDPVSARRVLEILLAYHRKGVTILLASHHLRQLQTIVSGRSVVLEKGRVTSAARLDPELQVKREACDEPVSG